MAPPRVYLLLAILSVRSFEFEENLGRFSEDICACLNLLSAKPLLSVWDLLPCKPPISTPARVASTPTCS